MEHIVSQILSGATGGGAYGLVFFVLLLCGLGVPLPEDVVLITGGFLVFKEAAQLQAMLAIAFLGILGGDSIAFLLGRKLGDRLQRRWPFRLFITPAKKHKVEKLFARYGNKIVVVARFMPGVRAVTYFLAGGAGMRYWTFILFDGLAALVSAPVFVLLGYYFGANIEWLLGAVRRGQWAVVGGLVVVAAAYLLVKYLRGRKSDGELAPDAPVPTPALAAEPLELPRKGREADLRVAK